jgi:Transposase IS116/IS110/IS902 family
MTKEVDTLKLMTRGAYDLQALRMQMGLRLCANFRSRLKDEVPEDSKPEDGDETEMGEAAIKVIDRLRDSYKRLTDGVARNRTLPSVQGFTGDALISDHAELVLVDQYIAIEQQESRQFRQMQGMLDQIPIYKTYLSEQRGVGPAMAAVLISYLDPRKARSISSFWKYAGLDVGPDGAGRSRRKEHLVEREYVNKAGKTATRMGITYEPFLKTKLTGVLGTSFLRSGSPWRKVYDDYKHRLESDPTREKVTVAEWKKRNNNEENVRNVWTPGRIHRASLRYMIKMFLADLWVKWRELEGLPVTEPYSVAKLGNRPHKAA